MDGRLTLRQATQAPAPRVGLHRQLSSAAIALTKYQWEYTPQTDTAADLRHMITRPRTDKQCTAQSATRDAVIEIATRLIEVSDHPYEIIRGLATAFTRLAMTCKTLEMAQARQKWQAIKVAAVETAAALEYKLIRPPQTQLPTFDIMGARALLYKEWKNV